MENTEDIKNKIELVRLFSQRIEDVEDLDEEILMTIADDRVSHHNYFISLEEWRILDKWRNR